MDYWFLGACLLATVLLAPRITKACARVWFAEKRKFVSSLSPHNKE